MSNNTKKRQRIGIDARFYGPLGKGLGRYVQEVVDNLIKINEEKGGLYEYVVFLSADNFDDFKIKSSFVEKKLLLLPWYSWREQIFFPAIIKKANLDLIHFPHFNVPIFCPIPFVVTIHDLILTRFPSRRASMLPATLYWFKQYAYRVVIKKALKNARQIITVSNFTKEDIINKFKIKSDKIKVSYEGVANLSDNAGDKISVDGESITLKKYNVEKPFILYVGNAYPHKNLESLLKVFPKLSLEYQDLSLVMVGKEDYFYKRLKEQAFIINKSRDDAKKLFIFPGYVPDKDLSCFYKHALFYIFPSFYEGFGLPPLEAMSYSCPVLSSNQASLPEIMSDAALYFNPYKEDDILDKMKIMINNNNNLRVNLIQSGLENIKRFSWLDCAEKTFDTYCSVLES